MKKTRLIVGVMLLSVSQLVFAKYNMSKEAQVLAAVQEAGNVGNQGQHRSLVAKLPGVTNTNTAGTVLKDAVKAIFDKYAADLKTCSAATTAHKGKSDVCAKNLEKEKEKHAKCSKRVNDLNKTVAAQKTQIAASAATLATTTKELTDAQGKINQLQQLNQRFMGQLQDASQKAKKIEVGVANIGGFDWDTQKEDIKGQIALIKIEAGQIINPQQQPQP